MNVKNILWDFDGVILDSMLVRDWGFREIFRDFDESLVDELITYHRINGGLSRYVKIRYFYEEILKKSITEERVFDYAECFSVLMKKELINRNNLIKDSVEFIKNNFKKFNFHIVSGSDQNELRYLCSKLEISRFFLSINGSPTPKKTLVANLLKEYDYNRDNTILIGDSMNDFEASEDNSISFYGYNNRELKKVSTQYLNNFHNFLK